MDTLSPSSHADHQAGHVSRGVAIEKVEARVISHRLAGEGVPFGIGRAIKRDAVIVKVTTIDGQVGYGEAQHGLSPTTVAEMVRTSLAETVIGEDAFATEDIWHKVYHRQLRSHGMSEAVYVALSGLDMALWDLKGKALGLSICRLLGGAPRKHLAYAGGITLGFREPEALSEELGDYVERFGFKAAKLRLGDNVDRDLARVRRIREDFGDAFQIMVDVNTSYDGVAVKQLLPGLEELGVAWLEEPFPKRHIPELSQLSGKAGISVAAGENHYGRDGVRELLEARAIDIVQCDASKTGGISELKKIADMAFAYGKRFAPHTSHSNLNYAAALHVMSASPSSWIFEAAGFHDNQFSDAAITAPIKIVDGYVETPDLPGLGVTVDEAALQAFAAIPGAQNAG